MRQDNVTEKVLESASPLTMLLGAENVEDVKKRIADVIVKAVTDDLENYRKEYYLFAPSGYVEDTINEAYYEVEKKMKKMYKDAMLEVAEKAVERFKKMVIEADNATVKEKMEDEDE